MEISMSMNVCMFVNMHVHILQVSVFLAVADKTEKP